ncbi:MAG TPA: FHA domain-containing protein [Polyangiales bacterium]|nr:FHA domain-containing protein [Polyangiales bacterium]
MRFISGKYQGGEFPLPPNTEIIVGRSSDLDMVLVEDMVSRRHAKIVVNADQVTIQDLGSTNGTFVNGERVKRATLNDGDRVLIGTSIIKLVTADAAIPPSAPPGKKLQDVAINRRTNQQRSMSGAIDEVPLPDLLQLFGSSRKTGVLVIKTDTDTGKVCLEKGVIVSATINDLEVLPSEKCVYRIITWQHGTFYMEPAEEGELPSRVQLSTEGALMEGLRIFDEVNRVQLPPMLSRIAVARPLTAKLRDLTPEQLDVFQVALHQTQLEAVFNNCSLDDIQVANALSTLIDGGYIKVTPPTAN